MNIEDLSLIVIISICALPYVALLIAVLIQNYLLRKEVKRQNAEVIRISAVADYCFRSVNEIAAYLKKKEELEAAYKQYLPKLVKGGEA